MTHLTLKKKEDDISGRLSNLTLKEKAIFFSQSTKLSCLRICSHVFNIADYSGAGN